VFAPISAIFSFLFFASTLPNGIRLIELSASGDSVEIIAGYDEPGLPSLSSTAAERSLIFNAYAAGGNIQLLNENDRTALRLVVPQWALPMLGNAQLLSTFFKDAPDATKGSDSSAAPLISDFRASVEEEIRSALLGPQSQPEYATDDAFFAISAPIPDALRAALAAVPRRARSNRPEQQVSRLPAERTLRFKSDLPTGAVIYAAPVPSVYYKEWYLVLLLDRVIRRTLPFPLQTTLLLSLHPYYYRIELPLAQGQFPEPAEGNLLQELQRLQLTSVDSQRLLAARQETLAYLDSKEVREWFARRGISARLEEGMQWVGSMTPDDLRAATRDLLLMNRVIATWPPKPKQTTVEVENLSGAAPELKPSPGAPPALPPLPLGEGRREAPGEGLSLEPAPFPAHQDPPQNVPVPERLTSGVSLAASNINGVFVSGGSLTKYDHELDGDTVKSFEKYPASRILVLTPAGQLDHAREMWSSFKGSDSREVGVPKGPVSGGDLPAVYVLGTIVELKAIQAGWWREVDLRIDATEGAALQIHADPDKRQQILEWIKEIAAQAPLDKDFAWMREVAIHQFDTARSDLQALTWERDPQATIQDIQTVVPRFVQDVAQVYF
jgi:hypothetical protein